MGREIPKGWKSMRLGDILTLEYGFSLPERRREPGPVPVIGSAGIVGSHKDCSVIGPGIVVGRKGSIGSITWVNEDFFPIDTTYYLSIDGSLVDLRWLFYLFVHEDLSKLNRATGIPGLNRDDVYSLRRSIPPLAEQRAIARVLDSIDEVIERTAEVIAATEKLRDALRHELLTRGMPGWHTEWKEVPRLGIIPADWKVVCLEDIAEVNPRRPSLNVKETTPIAFVPMAAVAENCRGIQSREIREYARVARGYTYFQENDVLFAKITPCLQNGKHALATDLTRGFGFGTTEFHVVRAGCRIEPVYLFCSLTQTANIEKCKQQFRGTAGQQRVHPETLRSLRVLLPPLSEQRAITEVLDIVYEAIQREEAALEVLKTLKASVGEALLTGRVRVPVGGAIQNG